jgi:hypothetical protein
MFLADRSRLTRWNETIPKMIDTVSGTGVFFQKSGIDEKTLA